MGRPNEGIRMTAPGRIEWASWEEPAPGPGQATIQVAGCGVCHTDLTFLYGGVATRKGCPIVLGHELSGVVVDAGAGAEAWLGRRVLAPAVSPCGTCAHCKRGRGTSCRSGLMPGNDHDGGFARLATVPARTLCDVDAGGPPGKADEPLPGGLLLAELSVLADAVTTPLQAIERAGLSEGMLAVFVGVGGVGGFGVQLAAARGARVVAVDVDEAKLARASRHGASAAIDARGGPKDVRAKLRDAAKALGAPPDGWRIFETSGTPKGQELAFALLGHAGVLSVVGFTPEPVSVRLSNLMALDASAHGSWGADPSVYPEAVRLCTSGAVQVRPFVRQLPLREGPALLEALHHGGSLERPILIP